MFNERQIPREEFAPNDDRLRLRKEAVQTREYRSGPFRKKKKKKAKNSKSETTTGTAAAE